jgi:hypothetical protein
VELLGLQAIAFAADCSALVVVLVLVLLTLEPLVELAVAQHLHNLRQQCIGRSA